jgi:hypothetical protein
MSLAEAADSGLLPLPLPLPLTLSLSLSLSLPLSRSVAPSLFPRDAAAAATPKRGAHDRTDGTWPVWSERGAADQQLTSLLTACSATL